MGENFGKRIGVVTESPTKTASRLVESSDRTVSECEWDIIIKFKSEFGNTALLRLVGVTNTSMRNYGEFLKGAPNTVDAAIFQVAQADGDIPMVYIASGSSGQ